MKPALAILAIYSLLVLAGCASPAASINPLYLDKEKPATEAGFEGTWLSEDQTSSDAARWEVTPEPDGCYHARVQKQNTEATKPKETELYRICLVQLQGKLFFDSVLLTKDIGATTVSASDLGPAAVLGHILGRIWLDKDTLHAAQLSSTWVEKNTSEGFRAMQGKAIITAGTDELRKFLVDRAEDGPAWTSAYFCRPGVDCELRATADRLARSPDDKDTLQTTAGFFMTRGDSDRAVALLRHAVAVAPQDSSSHGFLALALLSRNDFAAARNELALAQKLEKEDKENQDAYEFFIGGTHFLEGNFQESSRIFAKLNAETKAAGKESAQLVLFNYFSLARAGHRKKADAFLAKETSHFVGSPADHLLLLQAAGRVANPRWSQLTDDNSSDDMLLYAENCLAQGDMKAARAALEKVANSKDAINQVAAKIELERLTSKKQ